MLVLRAMLQASMVIRIAALLLLLTGSARAHPLAPALLELREVEGGRLEVIWKVSRFSAPGVALRPVLPARCRADAAPTETVDADSITRTWSMTCDPAGLVGERIGFTDLDTARIDALVRVTLLDGRLIRGL